MGGVIVDQWKEVLRSMPALVTQVNPSSVLVKMENGEVGLQILEEDTMMTKEPRDWATIDPSIGTGDKVTVHALLMDPSKKAPYLCTAVWRSGQTQPQVHREKLLQGAIDMYHTLALAMPEQLQKKDGEEHLPVPKFKFGSGLKIAGFAR